MQCGAAAPGGAPLITKGILLLFLNTTAKHTGETSTKNCQNATQSSCREGLTCRQGYFCWKRRNSCRDRERGPTTRNRWPSSRKGWRSWK